MQKPNCPVIKRCHQDSGQQEMILGGNLGRRRSWVLGDTSKFQPLRWNLYVSRLRAHSVSTILRIFPHTEDDSTIHIRTHLRVNLCSLAKSRTPRFSEILRDTLRYSASTTVVLLIPLFAHHCGCIYLFVLSVILCIIQDSS